MAGVALRHVSKKYGQVVAVRDVNLDIRDQEFFVLLGPSGCGKTTTLRMVAGLEAISEGSVVIGDQDVTEMPPKDRDIAMVFQNYALYPHMTVYDNMAFGLKLHRVSRPEIDRRVKEAAEILGLHPFLSRRPKELSGGQRQRVALGRAIVREPKAFLMDEPLSNLDAKLRSQTRVELKRLHRRLGATILYVTHDQTEAMTMGDRIVVMKDGVVQQVDTPEGIYQKPANTFVASFVGTPAMNLVRARVTRAGARFIAQFGGQELSLPTALANRLAVDANEAILGIRPENLTITAPTRDSDTVQGTIRLIEPLGHEQIVYLDVGGANLVSRASHRWLGKPGDRITVRWDLDHLHVFDPVHESRV